MSQLQRDLLAMYNRRSSLGVLAGAGLWLAGCGESNGRGADQAPDARPDKLGRASGFMGRAADGSACVAFPGETPGPFAADGQSGGNVASVLGSRALERSDIRSSFGGLAGTANGVPLALELRLVDVDNGCRPLPGRAVYVWHCDAEARYSLYELPRQNYLRGLQVADAGGWVRFGTVFPGAYPGRFPHIHFEVFESAEPAASGQRAWLTSQLALPPAVCRAVYATSALYPGSAGNLAETPLARDEVFADNTPTQLVAQTLAVAANTAGGYRAVATVGLTRRRSMSAGA